VLCKEPVLASWHSVIWLANPTRLQLEEHLLAQRCPRDELLRLSKSVATPDIHTI